MAALVLARLVTLSSGERHHLMASMLTLTGTSYFCCLPMFSFSKSLKNLIEMHVIHLNGCSGGIFRKAEMGLDVKIFLNQN